MGQSSSYIHGLTHRLTHTNSTHHNHRSEILSHIPFLFTRFDAVTKLALRCDRRSVQRFNPHLPTLSSPHAGGHRFCYPQTHIQVSDPYKIRASKSKNPRNHPITTQVQREKRTRVYLIIRCVKGDSDLNSVTVRLIGSGLIDFGEEERDVEGERKLYEAWVGSYGGFEGEETEYSIGVFFLGEIVLILNDEMEIRMSIQSMSFFNWHALILNDEFVLFCFDFAAAAEDIAVTAMAGLREVTASGL